MLKINQSLGRTLAASIVVLAALLLPTIAHAQASGATDVDINLPDVVILQYFSNLDVTLSAATLTTFLGATADQGTTTGSSFSADLNISADADFAPTNDPTALELTLSNAWAVRAISGGATSQTRVSIAITDNTLAHSGGGGESITITAADVQDSGGGGFAATASFAPPGLGNPEIGDVRLRLNLSNAGLAGDYLDGVYTITAENI